MELTGTDGTTFELTLAGYEFPGHRSDTHDANWLNVRMAVAGPSGTWTVTDPCLLTWEVEALSSWLRAAGDAPGTDREIGFTEPTLELVLEDHHGNSRRVRFRFAPGLRPRWAPDDGGSFDITITTDAPSLLRASRALAAELEAFPRRGPDGGR